MRYVFLTAYRNEAAIIETFLEEFTSMVRGAGLEDRAVLFMVDDLSLDGTRNVIAAYQARRDAIPVEVIATPTNLGNQGAMYYGLTRIEIAPEDVLVTFDCDGEDDVRQIPSIIELGQQNPGRLVLIERGRRAESLVFKLFFSAYKTIFRFLTHKTVIPNNFLLIPGELVSAIQRSPLVTVHFAYGILKLNAPHVAVTRDRRTRYGGRTSQNLFMLVSHGMVGLMVFYEVVVAKLFMLLFAFAASAGMLVLTGVLLPAQRAATHTRLLWVALGLEGAAMILFGLLVSAALALVFKVGVYSLIEAGGARRGEPIRPPAPESAGLRGARPGTTGTGAR